MDLTGYRQRETTAPAWVHASSVMIGVLTFLLLASQSSAVKRPASAARVLQRDDARLLVNLVVGQLQFDLLGRRREQRNARPKNHGNNGNLYGVHHPKVQKTAEQRASPHQPDVLAGLLLQRHQHLPRLLGDNRHAWMVFLQQSP